MLKSMNKSLSISPSPRAELPPASPSTRSKQSERRFAHRFRLTCFAPLFRSLSFGVPATQDNRQNRQLTSNRHTYNHTYIGKAFDNGNKYIFFFPPRAQFSTVRATRENIDHRRCQQVVAKVGLSSYCYGLISGERGRHRTRPTTMTTNDVYQTEKAMRPRPRLRKKFNDV